MKVKSWLEKHWIRGYNFEIRRSEKSWNTLSVALCLGYFSVIFTSFLKVGLSSWDFSLLTCALAPFSSSFLFSRVARSLV